MFVEQNQLLHSAYIQITTYMAKAVLFFGLAPGIRAKARLILRVHKSTTRSFLHVNHNYFMGIYECLYILLDFLESTFCIKVLLLNKD